MPLVGLTFLALTCAVGVAIDLGRGQVAQSKLQASLDAAGLAAGATVSQNPTEEELKPEAEKYLKANFAGKTVDAVITDFDLDLSEDEHIVTLTAEGELPTTIMQVFGKETMQIGARTEITREMTGLEVSLVLDVTGSMQNDVSDDDETPKIEVLKEAATELMDTLFGSKETVEDLWVGIVPFSHVVNVGTDHSGWLSDYDARMTEDNCIGWNLANKPSGVTQYCASNGPNVSTRTNPVTLVNDWMVSSHAGWYFAPHAWAGCVKERYATHDDVTDVPPSEVGFPTFFNPDTSGGNNNWRSNSGNYNVDTDPDEDRSANRDCLMSPITPMTNVKSTLVDAIDGLEAKGNTLLAMGAIWGWRMLSPEWRGQWGGAMDANSLPLDYHADLSQKVMIFMTDGFNQMPDSSIMTSYGFLNEGNLGTTSQSTADTRLYNKLTTICSAMKANGILIYTIVFGNGSNSTAKSKMKNCASEEDYYFYAESADALDGAFSAIGDSLSNLRISK